MEPCFAALLRAVLCSIWLGLTLFRMWSFHRAGAAELMRELMLDVATLGLAASVVTLAWDGVVPLGWQCISWPLLLLLGGGAWAAARLPAVRAGCRTATAALLLVTVAAASSRLADRFDLLASPREGGDIYVDLPYEYGEEGGRSSREERVTRYSRFLSLVESLGRKVHVAGRDESLSALLSADEVELVILVMRERPFPLVERRALRRFLEGGGALLLVTDHTDIGGCASSVRFLAEILGVDFSYDTVWRRYFMPGGELRLNRRHWMMSANRHYYTSVGGSLKPSLLALGRFLPLVEARPPLYGDRGDPRDVPSHLGDGVPTGDDSRLPPVLAAAWEQGASRVVCLADSAPLQDGVLWFDAPFVRRILAWLLRRRGQPVSGLAFVLRTAAVLLAPLTLLLALAPYVKGDERNAGGGSSAPSGSQWKFLLPSIALNLLVFAHTDFPPGVPASPAGWTVPSKVAPCRSDAHQPAGGAGRWLFDRSHCESFSLFLLDGPFEEGKEEMLAEEHPELILQRGEDRVVPFARDRHWDLFVEAVLRNGGMPAVACRSDELSRGLATADTVMFVQPCTPFSERETETLRSFMHRGGVAVVFGSASFLPAFGCRVERAWPACAPAEENRGTVVRYVSFFDGEWPPFSLSLNGERRWLSSDCQPYSPAVVVWPGAHAFCKWRGQVLGAWRRIGKGALVVWADSGVFRDAAFRYDSARRGGKGTDARALLQWDESSAAGTPRWKVIERFIVWMDGLHGKAGANGE